VSSKTDNGVDYFFFRRFFAGFFAAAFFLFFAIAALLSLVDGDSVQCRRESTGTDTGLLQQEKINSDFNCFCA
jgi:hypothetical protein